MGSPNGSHSSAAITPANYPLNCWWVAGTGEEIGRRPLGRWFLDRPVVLYRTEAGAVVALDDRCLHRWAPLSHGYLEGDQLVCGYHGARFGADGRCVRFPTQSSVPATACIRSYAVVERGPFVWIWLGDERRRSAVPVPPDFAWSSDPAWTVVRGSMTLEANYMLFHENVLDLTHFNYLHRDSFKITNRRPPDYRVEGNRVVFRQVDEAADLSAADRAAMGMDPFTLRSEEEGSFVTPALHSVETLTLRAPNAQLPERQINYVHHFVTPESPTRTHYWWLIGLGIPMPPEVTAGMTQTVATGYAEDKSMLEAIQRTIERDARHRQYPEFSFKGDGGGIQARRALQRILEADVGQEAEVGQQDYSARPIT